MNNLLFFLLVCLLIKSLFDSFTLSLIKTKFNSLIKDYYITKLVLDDWSLAYFNHMHHYHHLEQSIRGEFRPVKAFISMEKELELLQYSQKLSAELKKHGINPINPPT